MTLAIDTSTLAAIFKGEPDASAWVDLLSKLAAGSALVATDIVWAEIAPIFPDLETLRDHMDDLGITYDPMTDEAGFSGGAQLSGLSSGWRAAGTLDPGFPDCCPCSTAGRRSRGGRPGYIRKYFRKLQLHSI